MEPLVSPKFHALDGHIHKGFHFNWPRGGAWGFAFKDLKGIAGTKSTDNKNTIAHYIAKNAKVPFPDLQTDVEGKKTMKYTQTRWFNTFSISSSFLLESSILIILLRVCSNKNSRWRTQDK